MGSVLMRQMGAADGRALPSDGQFLASFDFEAHGGLGEISLTTMPEAAMRFPDMAAAFAYRLRSPECAPLRLDGQPNRPLTAANWAFEPSPLDPNQ